MALVVEPSSVKPWLMLELFRSTVRVPPWNSGLSVVPRLLVLFIDVLPLGVIGDNAANALTKTANLIDGIYEMSADLFRRVIGLMA